MRATLSSPGLGGSGQHPRQGAPSSNSRSIHVLRERASPPAYQLLAAPAAARARFGVEVENPECRTAKSEGLSKPEAERPGRPRCWSIGMRLLGAKGVTQPHDRDVMPQGWHPSRLCTHGLSLTPLSRADWRGSAPPQAPACLSAGKSSGWSPGVSADAGTSTRSTRDRQKVAIVSPKSRPPCCGECAWRSTERRDPAACFNSRYSKGAGGVGPSDGRGCLGGAQDASHFLVVTPRPALAAHRSLLTRSMSARAQILILNMST